MKALRQRKGRIITKAGSHTSEKKKTVKGGGKNSKRGEKTHKPKSWFFLWKNKS